MPEAPDVCRCHDCDIRFPRYFTNGGLPRYCPVCARRRRRRSWRESKRRQRARELADKAQEIDDDLADLRCQRCSFAVVDETECCDPDCPFIEANQIIALVAPP